MFSKVPSLHNHKGASVFTNGLGYDAVYPWKSKSEHPVALSHFIHDVGIPQTIVSDGAPELTSGDTRTLCNNYRIQQKVTVPYSPWQNLAEASIRQVKQTTRKTLRRTGAPLRTWSYCAQWVTWIRRFTASDHPSLNGRTPYEHVTGSTPDISPIALFDFWQPVYYYMPVAEFPYEKKLIGRWLGKADNSTDDMANIVLAQSGQTLIRKDVWAIPDDEFKTPAIQARVTEYDTVIKQKLDVSGDASQETFPLPRKDLFSEAEEDDGTANVQPADESASVPEADDTTPELFDEYLSAEVMLPHGGEPARGKVIARAKDGHGKPLGIRNQNPILDTRCYEVQFPDGSTETFATNLIAENLFSQIDSEGHSQMVFKDIIGHRFNDKAVRKDDPKYLDGTKRHTTIGWDIQVEWANGTQSWLPMKDVKHSNPVELAEYAITAKIADEPAFAWWVRYTLRKRDRIIKKVKSRYWKRTHKFGIEMPKNVKQAYEIDRRTGTDFWAKAIEKEMRNVNVAFEFRDGDIVPKGYKHINCHMIFDVKSDLTRKARFVANGNETDEPKDSVYSSVVSRDSVRIAFTIAALNDLDVMAADIQNAYLNAPTTEKCYTTAGLEFGPDNVGRPVIIVRALYGMRSSGARFRDHMAATLRDGGFKSCLADPDVWMRPNVKPNGTKYWEYVLCYVDDVLVISHDPKAVMEHFQSRYTLKPGSVGEPKEYLGTEIKKFDLPNSPDGKPRWAMSSDLYVKRALADVERELESAGSSLKKRVSTPMAMGYRPEVDSSPELDASRANYFQGLIGVLRWIVELGRIDILVPISMLSRYLALPREGHLEQVLHIFAYLKTYNRSSLVFDDTTPYFDEKRFSQPDWSGFYPDAADMLPPNMPEARGKPVTTTCFVDADHAGCQATRRSHTGVLMFVQRAPILWYSKRQNTVESSTFGSEFVAMKTAIELTEGLRYKLRMMGVPLDGETNVFCDNESVFKSATIPSTTLKKKHNAIAYHRTREAQAAGIIRIAWEESKSNLADVLTKLLPRPQLHELCSRILW